MNIEELKTKTEADISEYITKKIIELKKKTGKEVTSIQFTARVDLPLYFQTPVIT